LTFHVLYVNVNFMKKLVVYSVIMVLALGTMPVVSIDDCCADDDHAEERCECSCVCHVGLTTDLAAQGTFVAPGLGAARSDEARDLVYPTLVDSIFHPPC
jgi:hypothetical protein